MDMTDNEAMGEGVHGKTEKITGDRLHDVLHELGVVGLDALPFLCGSHTFIGYGFPAETVLPDSRLYIG